MKLQLGLFTLVFTLLCPALAQAPAYSKDLALPVGAELEIKAFDDKNQMVQLLSTKFPGEGHSWVKAKDLGKAIRIEKGQEIRVQHLLASGDEKLIGKKIKLLKKIPTYASTKAQSK